MKTSVKLSLFIALFSIFTSNIVIAAVNLGVISSRGALKAQAKWGPLAKYFGDEIGDSVKLVTLTPDQVESAVSQKRVDYILVNPVVTAVVNKKYKTVPLATLKKKFGSQFAGVIISKKGSDITSSSDLKGKKVMAYKFGTSAAAYTFQVYHLKQKGITPKDFSAFTETRKKQDDIVLAVKAGLVDVGFVKSGLLEAMEKEKKIKISDFNIIDKQNDSLKKVHSTELYPHWFLSATSSANKSQSKKLATAALSLSASNAAAKKAKIKGFVEPLSLDKVLAALKSLNLPPFSK
ncbi:MAG: phosphate/phosphite/phosphonate ABC transporter substrate-binding protein [Acidiferrobacterales bacterium]